MSKSKTNDQNNKTYVQVILPRPFEETFTYCVSSDKSEKDLLGAWVLVPLGREHVLGCIYSVTKESRVASQKLKDVIVLLSGVKKLPQSLLKLIEQLANYYFVPIGEALRLAMPRWISQTAYIYKEVEIQNVDQQGQLSFLEPLEKEAKASKYLKKTQLPLLIYILYLYFFVNVGSLRYPSRHGQAKCFSNWYKVIVSQLFNEFK